MVEVFVGDAAGSCDENGTLRLKTCMFVRVIVSSVRLHLSVEPILHLQFTTSVSRQVTHKDETAWQPVREGQGEFVLSLSR